MYKLRTLLAFTAAATLLLASTLPCSAELFYYDPFLLPDSDGDPITDPAEPALGEYNLGPLGGQNPIVGPYFTGAWTAAADGAGAVVQQAGLSYLGAPALGGSQTSDQTIGNSRPRRALTTPWTATTTGTRYIGFLVSFGTGFYDDGIDGNDMGYRAVEFWQQPNGDGFMMGIQYNTFGTNENPTNGRMNFDLNGRRVIEGSPDNFIEDNGVTHAIVVRVDLSADDLSDSVSVYLDPVQAVEPEIPSSSINGINFLLGSMGGVTVFGGSGGMPTFDELRIATTFAEALPKLPIPGDTDGDDDVDLDDYHNIVTHMNLSGAAVPNLPTLHPDVARADGTQGNDGRVTIADYRLWRDNRTDLGGSGALKGPAVPEPASAVFASLMSALLSLVRWQRCRH